MKFEFPEINKVCFETESIAATTNNFDGNIKVGIDEDNNASNVVI